MIGGYVNISWDSFPAVDSSQLYVGQRHADHCDAQQSHLVLPEAPHGVVDVLVFQEQLPWDAAATDKRGSACVCVCVCVIALHSHGGVAVEQLSRHLVDERSLRETERRFG